jgi:uncharacterized NAD(P)/FAD-binding protein YdhS
MRPRNSSIPRLGLILTINVGRDYAVVDRSGKSLGWLSYVGPLLKAQLWEATAVPGLLQHVRALATQVAQVFTAPVESNSI